MFPLHRTPADAPLLAPDEAARAARFRFPRDRDRYIAGRATLRRILSVHAGAAPAALAFRTGAAGKPALPHGPHFNLSHTADLAALAIAGFEIGIDIEHIRPVEPGLARRYFAADEADALDALPAADRLPAFYACWTRKEAYIKARGDGLALPLDSFSVSLGLPPALLRARDDDPAAWTLHSFTPAPGAAGAIAARRPRLRVIPASVPAAPP